MKNGNRSEPWQATPNLDAIAAQGAMLTNQYCAAPVCAPSRASILLGVNQGHSNVRDNQFDKALQDTYTVGNVLQKAGYTTGLVGKWGLQGVADIEPNWPAHPLNRGFDYSYAYMRHKDGRLSMFANICRWHLAAGGYKGRRLGGRRRNYEC